MWPSLISFGPITVHSFGVLLFLGVFFGGFKLWQKAREAGWDEALVMDGWLLAGAGALISGRIGYVFSHWAEFDGNWYKMLFFTKFPGLSGTGAWLGAVLIFLIYAWKKQWNLIQWLEAVAGALIMTEIFIRLGQFLAGTGLGKTAPAGFGLNFPGVDGQRWPVQLFWFLALVLVSRLFDYWEKHYRSYGLKPGFLIAVYMLITGSLTVIFGFLAAEPQWWWGAGLIFSGGLLLFLCSGINLTAPKLKPEPKPARKKRGFDYV